MRRIRIEKPKRPRDRHDYGPLPPLDPRDPEVARAMAMRRKKYVERTEKKDD